MGNVPEKISAKIIPYFGVHKHILVVGGGADNTIIELIRNKKCENITHIDISRVLSSKARLRLQQSGFLEKAKVDFIVKDFLSMESEIVFDAIVFPYYLDLFLDFEIEENIRKAKQFLTPKGNIYVIDFSSSTKRSMWQKFKAWGLYTIFQPVTKVSRKSFPNHKILFENCGLDEVQSETFKNGFYKFSKYECCSDSPNDLY